jgi:hypothetical protein
MTTLIYFTFWAIYKIIDKGGILGFLLLMIVLALLGVR